PAGEGTAAREHPRDGNSHHAFRARLLQSPRARVKSRASRKYIIYQQDAEVVNSRAFSNFVSATHCLPALASGEQQSRRTRFRPYQQVRTEGQFQFSGQRTRDQFCLIVSALALPRGMERNGNRDIRREQFRLDANFFLQPGGEPAAQPRQFLVFQHPDCTRHLVVVFAVASRAVKTVSVAPARETQGHGCVCRNFRQKRASACGAAGSLEWRKRGETAVANGEQAGVRQHAVTNYAWRREQHRRKRFERFAENHNAYLPERNGSNLYYFEVCGKEEESPILRLLAIRWRRANAHANEQGSYLNLGIKRKRGGYSRPCSCFS